nr:unnamed protein product [Callosobruchus analis]
MVSSTVRNNESAGEEIFPCQLLTPSLVLKQTQRANQLNNSDRFIGIWSSSQIKNSRKYLDRRK